MFSGARDSAKEALWELCEGKISDLSITCGETIYQSDRVIEAAYEWLHDICEIIGYAPNTDDDVEY